MLELSERTRSTEGAIRTIEFNSVSDTPRYPAARHYETSFVESPWRVFTEKMLSDNDIPHTVWKPCQHYKCIAGAAQPYGNGSTIYSNRYSADNGSNAKGMCVDPYLFYRGSYGEAGELNSGLPAFLQPQPDGGFISPPSALGQLVDRSLSTMLPLIRSELSLVNSIIELKDFVTLKQFAQSAVLNILFITRRLRAANVKWYDGQTLRSVLRLASSNYLQWKFNFAPLISDIQGIYKALKTYERRINDLVCRSGRVQSKHFAFNWNEFDKSVEDERIEGLTYIWPELPMSCRYRRLVSHASTTFHAQIQYNYNYTDYQLAHARVLGLLDTLGVNLNPVIIWNAIPWSFVVDWVLGVNRALSQLGSANMKPQINIHRYLWSVSRARSIYVSRRTSWADWTPTSYTDCTEVPLPVVTETAYRRDVGIPDHSSLVASGLNPQEFTLGASLVLSRKPRFHKRAVDTWASARRDMRRVRETTSIPALERWARGI